MVGNPAVCAAGDPLLLTGQDLRLGQVESVARGRKVVLDSEALHRMEASHELLMAYAAAGRPVYGLTVGVGLNKDKAVFKAGGKLTDGILKRSREFNRSALRAHAAGAGPDMTKELVRAAMVIRLNTMLLGRTGAQPKVARLYADFLNAGITPVVPSQGSVGEADITLAPHVGLVMLGEWQADFDGERMTGKKALEKAGLTVLDPIGKDALAILSTNAFSAAKGVLAVLKAERLLKTVPLVLGLSLEGLNGNMAPFTHEAAELRPFPGNVESAAAIRKALAGSYLWQPYPKRPLQDPLSYRTAGVVLGSALHALKQAREMLRIQINASDDNPAVLEGMDMASMPQQYVLQTAAGQGAVLPTANFEPLPFVLALEQLSLALCHVSRGSALRTIKLSDPHFTGLSRFLAPNDVSITFGAIQKPVVAINTSVRQLANPVSPDGLPVAGDIEDTSTNALLVAARLDDLVAKVYTVMGLELLHAAQAVDLRRRGNPDLALGDETEKLLISYRGQVPFVDADRPLTPDIRKSTDFLESLR
ncbi:HAL/PAL/TAL family ammonia-lyase [Salidesulfovibrio brasiliensis]|uniref:HAL/PAL/TAL family ammonia-lyase n=1 Tax=Salidesulfovibrio brasiliensis TaxID=221711 RepID=UPI0006D29157|nr:aromatic amino acid ammonia-lyase [Salidesulfovibrio brasiliensis]